MIILDFVSLGVNNGKFRFVALERLTVTPLWATDLLELRARLD
jgi:hypothetical protein